MPRQNNLEAKLLEQMTEQLQASERQLREEIKQKVCYIHKVKTSSNGTVKNGFIKRVVCNKEENNFVPTSV